MADRPDLASVAATPAPGVAATPSAIVVIVTGLFLGVFAGLVAGIVGYNGISTIGPRTTAEARLVGYEIEYNQSGSTRESRRTKWVNGVTDSGRTWRIANDDAYDVASRSALPMDVEVTISEGGDHAVYWAKSEDDDTHKVLVLEVQGDIRNALMVPASAVLNAPTANVSITQVAQENFEGLEADLPIAVLQAAEIEPITPPVIQVDLPFNLNE